MIYFLLLCCLSNILIFLINFFTVLCQCFAQVSIFPVSTKYILFSLQIDHLYFSVSYSLITYILSLVGLKFYFISSYFSYPKMSVYPIRIEFAYFSSQIDYSYFSLFTHQLHFVLPGPSFGPDHSSRQSYTRFLQQLSSNYIIVDV